ncbi:MAG: D-alanyl-D-alanine carboxypeptidase [Myxococcota bacterium]|nr:D-alanyl-D-alanine carboxypeptidase [Myxococcota bacterium]
MKLSGSLVVIALVGLVASIAEARPQTRKGIAKRAQQAPAKPTAKPAAKPPAKRGTRSPLATRPKAPPKADQAAQRTGAHARVAYTRAGELRSIPEVQPRRTEPLTAEEATAEEIQKLLRGPQLRRGVTGLYVADARTGEPLFAVNATDQLNPASNVKMISTATALELLGPAFRYPTRLLGPAPTGGVVRGDVYLLGSYDPTLSATDLHEIATTMARAGITSIDGSITVSSDPTRDGIYRSVIPVEITAGEPGQAPTAQVPANFDLLDVKVVAVTSKQAHRPKLTYTTELVRTEQNYPRIRLTIGGKLGKGGATMYPLWTKQRTANAAYSMIAALRANSISITGEMKVADLGDFVSDAVLAGTLPIELGRHESRALGDIVKRINKWSVNWLSDRVVMTAAALARREQPSMELALQSMYGWLARHPHIDKAGVVIDTGSGLSYRSKITSRDLVAVVRAAGGFLDGADAGTAEAWLGSLAVAGSDGTLRSRFRGTEAAGRVLGKTGTLSTVIALSGILDTDPARPLAFALITNTDAPLAKRLVRRAHEQVISEICKYLAKTTKTAVPAGGAHLAPVPPTPIEIEVDVEDVEHADAALDAETARSQ